MASFHRACTSNLACDSSDDSSDAESLNRPPSIYLSEHEPQSRSIRSISRTASHEPANPFDDAGNQDSINPAPRAVLRDSQDPFKDPTEEPDKPLPTRYSILSNRPNFQQDTQKLLDRAKAKDKWRTLPRWLRITIQYTAYMGLLCIIYFVLIGWPLWHGVIYSFWFVYKTKIILTAGVSIFIGVAFLYAILPLFSFFEPEWKPDGKAIAENRDRASKTALVIPCHKSAELLPSTLTAALKTFPPRNVFIIDNSKEPNPPDNTQAVCKEYGVRYIYLPVASKIAGQFVGVQAAYDYEYILMIDDDVCLPDAFPVVTDRIELGKARGHTKCIGYGIRSVGSNRTPGTLCQQAQSVEYLISGLTRAWLAKWASAIFPHGAISLWERTFLEECFRRHPGYKISEDWFLGHVCRTLGGRVKMCTSVIVETETPAHLFRSGSGSRAGYGEMTVTKQRMQRWNFFIVSRMWYDAVYILFRWRLGLLEIGTKIWVFQEIYTSLLALALPIILPITIGAQPGFTIPIIIAVSVVYYLLAVIANEVQFRKRGVRVHGLAVYVYYPFYGLYLNFLNSFSSYLALFKYAKYYTLRHPKVDQDVAVLEVMLALSKRPAGVPFGSQVAVPIPAQTQQTPSSGDTLRPHLNEKHSNAV